MIQGLRLHAPSAGAWGSIPGRGAGSHMPQPEIPHTSTRIEDTVCAAKLKKKEMGGKKMRNTEEEKEKREEKKWGKMARKTVKNMMR